MNEVPLCPRIAERVWGISGLNVTWLSDCVKEAVRQRGSWKELFRSSVVKTQLGYFLPEMLSMSFTLSTFRLKGSFQLLYTGHDVMEVDNSAGLWPV